MQTYARWLFGTAAAFNILIGLSLVFLRPLLQARLGIEPAEGANLVRGEVGPQLPALVMGDALYALLFLDFVRRTGLRGRR